MEKIQVGQRIDVFEILKTPYSETSFKVGRQYAEIAGNYYHGNESGRDMVTDNPAFTSLHHNINIGNSQMEKVGTMIIKSVK